MGYQATVREQLKDMANVWAPTENGGNSKNVLAHLDEWVVSRAPDLVHVNCGLHDIIRAAGRNQPAVSLEEYTTNVRTILNRLQAETKAIVVWVATTPVNEKRHREVRQFDRLEVDVVAYNATATRVAGELKVRVHDLFGAILPTERDVLLGPDGVHFTPAGYAFLGKRVADCIRSCLAAANPVGK